MSFGGRPVWPAASRMNRRFERRGHIDELESGIAQLSKARKVIRKQPIEAICCERRHIGIESTPLCIFCKYRLRTDVHSEHTRLGNTSASAAASRSPRLSPSPAIGWTTCAASPSSASLGRCELLRDEQRKAITMARPDEGQRTAMRPETLFEFGKELDRSSSARRARARVRRFRPHQRGAIAGERQDGKRSGGTEMLLSAALMRQFMADRGDDSGLVIVPAKGLDARRLPRRRLAPVSGHHKVAA